jgi:hypothetical protein
MCDGVLNKPEIKGETKVSSPFERRLVSTEKPLNQFVTADSKMRGHIIKNAGQCSHFKRIVVRNRDMMRSSSAADGCPFAA